VRDLTNVAVGWIPMLSVLILRACPFCVAILSIEGYGLEVRGIVFRLPASAESLCLHQRIQTGSGITQPPGALSRG